MACAAASPVHVCFEPNPEWTHCSPLDMPTLSPEDRSSLLNSESIILHIRHSGAQHGFPCQTSARPLLKHAHRPSFHHELLHQDPQKDGSYLFRFPLEALLASSTYLDLCFQVRPAPELRINVGNLFPGYVKEVLDWYVEALSADAWFDFPIFDCECIWYYYYIYAAMRVLGMHRFTRDLQAYLVGHLDGASLAGLHDVQGLGQVLQHLHSRDPVAVLIAQLCIASIGCAETEVQRLRIAGGIPCGVMQHGAASLEEQRRAAVDDIAWALEGDDEGDDEVEPFGAEHVSVCNGLRCRGDDDAGLMVGVEGCDSSDEEDGGSECSEAFVTRLDYRFGGYVEGDA